jgi:hypothetical protein
MPLYLTLTEIILMIKPIPQNGGALYMKDGMLKVVNNTFTANTAVEVSCA